MKKENAEKTSGSFVSLRWSRGISEINPGISLRPLGEVTTTRAVFHLPCVFVSANKIDL